MADLLAHSLSGLSLGAGPSARPSLSFSSCLRGTAVAGSRQSAAVASGPAGFFVEAAQNALKRQRQSETHRQYNKQYRSAVRTRFSKVLKTIAASKDLGQESQILPIEKLISEAHSEIDRAVKRGIMHINTAARRKQRMARHKKQLLIRSGLYIPKQAVEDPDRVPTPIPAIKFAKASFGALVEDPPAPAPAAAAAA